MLTTIEYQARLAYRDDLLRQAAERRRLAARPRMTRIGRALRGR